jgi:hypothetical protein
MRVRSSVVSGFVRDERFYTRDEVAAMLVSALELGQRSPDTLLRKAA